MGLATTAVLMFSNMAISMLRNVIPEKVRIPSYIIIIAGFVTVVMYILKAYLPELDKALGIYIPLIVANCILLALFRLNLTHQEGQLRNNNGLCGSQKCLAHPFRNKIPLKKTIWARYHWCPLALAPPANPLCKQPQRTDPAFLVASGRRLPRCPRFK